MVREGYWTWPGGGRYEDVPASNFLGWFVTGSCVFAVWSLLDSGDSDATTTARSPSTSGPGSARRSRTRSSGGGRGRAGRSGRDGAFAAPALAKRLAMRVVVVGAGVGGLAAAVRCLEAGHAVTVLEATSVPGGKAGRFERDGFAFDTGPSLVTMPWVFRDLLGDRIDLVRVEPVTRVPVRRRVVGRAERRPPAGDGGARGVVARRGCRLGALPRDVRGDVARVGGLPHGRAAVAAAPRRPPLGPARRAAGEAVVDAAPARPRPRARPAAADDHRALRDLRGRRPPPRPGRPCARGLRRARLRCLAPARRRPRDRPRAGRPRRGARRRDPLRHARDRPRARRARARRGGGDPRRTGPRRLGRVERRRGSSSRALARRAGAGGGGAVPLRATSSSSACGGGRRGCRTTSSPSPATTTPSSTTCSSTAGRSPSRRSTSRCSAVTDPSEAPPGDENWFVLANAPSGLPEHAFDGYDEHLVDAARRRLDVRDRIVVARDAHARPTSSARPARSAARSTAPPPTAASARCAARARASAAARTSSASAAPPTPAAACRSSPSAAQLAARIVG